MPDAPFKLSPSDFAFLWSECKRCFYLKVARGFPRPYTPMAKIFTVIDSEMKKFYMGKRTEEISDELPVGSVAFGDRLLTSAAIKSNNHPGRCQLVGKCDTILKFDDGSFGVIDFKTSAQKPENVLRYSRQLHAYAYALENPDGKSLKLTPVTVLGLLVFEPKRYTRGKTGAVGLAGSLVYQKIERDDQGFMKFIDEVLELLGLEEPPVPSPGCSFCKYREQTRELHV